MSWSSCPFCTLQVLSTELERHANNHFEDPQLSSSSQVFPHHVDENIHIRAGEGFMTLLKHCLECESTSSTSTSFLSGYVDHFQSVAFEDVGWGCGWRNIQMLASHLLVQRQQQTTQLLFGGLGFVPDIPSLQTWLQIAWEKGFDPPGSNHFNHKIYGKPTWIGTTECAALFRSFGLRARIVDFSTPQVPGSSTKLVSHQLLADWVWSYFSDNNSSLKNQVVVTEKSPLYFQHYGHSRTIVGIQLKSLPNGTQQSNLLILDPAHRTQVLESCLTKKVGWQRFIKRGVHTLKKMEYQLCYVDPGIATGAEMEKLKTLDSTRFELVNNIKTVACVDQSLVAIYFIPTKTRVLDVGKPKPNSTCIPLYSWLLSFGWVVYYHLTISVVEAALIKCNKQWLLDMDSVVVIYFGWLAMWCSVLLFIPFCGFG